MRILFVLLAFLSTGALATEGHTNSSKRVAPPLKWGTSSIPGIRDRHLAIVREINPKVFSDMGYYASVRTQLQAWGIKEIYTGDIDAFVVLATMSIKDEKRLANQLTKVFTGEQRQYAIASDVQVAVRNTILHPKEWFPEGIREMGDVDKYTFLLGNVVPEREKNIIEANFEEYFKLQCTIGQFFFDLMTWAKDQKDHAPLLERFITDGSIRKTAIGYVEDKLAAARKLLSGVDGTPDASGASSTTAGSDSNVVSDGRYEDSTSNKAGTSSASPSPTTAAPPPSRRRYWVGAAVITAVGATAVYLKYTDGGRKLFKEAREWLKPYT